jgi:hypothetical protein
MTLVTRENHLKYINKLTPYLVISYALQSYLYLQWAPKDLASEVIVFLGAALTLLIGGFIFFGQHHKIIFHQHHLEVRFDLLGYQQELLYRDIQWIEVARSAHGFATLILTSKDHAVIKLFYVDQPLSIKSFLEQKRSGLVVKSA